MLKLFYIAIIISLFDKILSLPLDVEKCKIDDESCLQRSANKILTNYKGGIADMSLASLDPFVVDEINFTHDYGSINVKKGNITNAQMRGLSSATIDKFSGFDKDLLEIQFKIPKSTFNGSVVAETNILFLPVTTDGTFVLNLFDYEAKLNIKLERYSKNGSKYFKTNGFCIHSTVRTGDIESTGIANKIINWFVNFTFDFLFKSSIKSFVDDYWTVYYEKAINVTLTKVPISELFDCERDRY